MRWLKILGAVAVINVIARLLGFGREVIIGYQYGTSFRADSIITAFTIPNFIYLVVGGAITTAFISVQSKLSKDKQTRFRQNIFTLLTIILGALSLVSILFAAFWIDLFFSGMSPEAAELTTKLYQVMAPASLFLVIGMWLSGLWNMEGHYRFTAFSTLLFNGLFLLIGVAFTQALATFSYAIGATIGSLAMALTLYIAWQKKYGPIPMQWKWQANQNELARFIKLSVPILFGGATLQFYFFIQRIFAAQLEEGLIASINYATKMTQFPQAILMTSVTTVIYPLLAKAIGDGQEEKVGRIYQKGVRWLVLLLVPATVYLYVYAEQIIRLIFEYGAFDQLSTARTFPLLQWFAFSMLPLALTTFITRFFYAKEQSYLPVFYSLLSVFGINLVIIVGWLEELGPFAIALGTVVATIVNMVLLCISAYVRYSYTIGRLGYVVFSVAGGFVIWGSSLLLDANDWVMLIGGGLITGVWILAGLRLYR
ncbi:murein biosynthesis integral membrane protein MurJ [Gracilibacillus sp. YIM 98692]|uniref:murein biosynthesis integral membrane protein MurJ n=1 Tax=Gracilibacillus sp. YIM 98692 TaxID=2663532 RepID=UPI001969FEE1|nr:murein biosynthesis integral membrane protein MurJ [Gracilibacillus sp. YIM 98692]